MTDTVRDVPSMETVRLRAWVKPGTAGRTAVAATRAVPDDGFGDVPPIITRKAPGRNDGR